MSSEAVTRARIADALAQLQIEGFAGQVHVGERRGDQTLDACVRIGDAIVGGEFREARLRSGRLARSRWIHCDLSRADLAGADLRRADLSGHVTLRGARLRGARLRYANLAGVDLSGADLSDADLTGADLTGATLTRARLARADLRGARGLTIDGNNVAGAKFSYDHSNQWTTLGQRLATLGGALLDPIRGRAIWTRMLYGPLPATARPDRGSLWRRGRAFVRSLVEPADLWFALKRIYTGPWLFLNLLALMAFFLPRLEMAVARISLEQLQLAARGGTLTQAAGDVATRTPVTEAITSAAAAAAAAEEDKRTRRVPLWWVLLGLHRGWVEGLMSTLLLAYVLFRSLLTIQIASLTSIERDNGITPGLSDYRRLLWAHLATRGLMAIATWVFLWDFYRLMAMQVTILQH